MSDGCFAELYWKLFTVSTCALIVLGASVEVWSMFKDKRKEKENG